MVVGQLRFSWQIYQRKRAVQWLKYMLLILFQFVYFLYQNLDTFLKPFLEEIKEIFINGLTIPILNSRANGNLLEMFCNFIKIKLWHEGSPVNLLSEQMYSEHLFVRTPLDDYFSAFSWQATVLHRVELVSFWTREKLSAKDFTSLNWELFLRPWQPLNVL